MAVETIYESYGNKLIGAGAVSSETGDGVDWKSNGILGAKNLIPYPYYYTTRTINGITFTDNGDGTVTANGTASERTEFSIRNRTQESFKLPVGNYLLSGCMPNGATNKWEIAIYYTTPSNTGVNLVNDYGLTGDVQLNITDAMMSQYFTLGISLVIFSGATVENLVFKPMIRLAEDTDDTYQPYAMTNKELTDRLKQADWNQSDTTAPDYIKNKPNVTSTVSSGSTDLITSGGVYSYVDTMITQALSGSY